MPDRAHGKLLPHNSKGVQLGSWESGIFFLSAFSLSVSPWLVGGCEHDDKARWYQRRSTCVTLSSRLLWLRTNPRPLTARMHCSARSPAYLHTTYITLFPELEFVSGPLPRLRFDCLMFGWRPRVLRLLDVAYTSWALSVTVWVLHLRG